MGGLMYLMVSFDFGMEIGGLLVLAENRGGNGT